MLTTTGWCSRVWTAVSAAGAAALPGRRWALPCFMLASGLLGCSGRDSTRLSEAEAQPGAGQPGADGAAEADGLPLLPAPAEVAPPEGPAGPPDTIYQREHLIEVRVEMAPEDWETLSAEGIGLGEILFPANGFRTVPEYTHFAATVSVDGVAYENVDIRKKGYIGSLSVIRPSLKLDFERRQGAELVAGDRRMTLNNDLQDPSHVKQCLSYDLFHEIGLPAPRCNYAHVVVNGVDLGIYSHVEPVNKPLLRRYFENVDGNLYEGQLSDFNPQTKQFLEVESDPEGNDLSDVQAVIDALALPDDQVVTALGQLVDLDQFRDFWALETLLGHWDGYAGNSNNYFAYHDPTSGKFHFIPWGTDQTFVGDNPNDNLPYLIQVYAAGTISNRLYALPDQRALYRARLAELEATLWDVPALLDRVTALARLAPGSSREAVTRLESYIRGHGEALRAALAAPAPDWPVAPPQPPGDPCQGTFGDLSASFAMQWGSVANVADINLDGSSDVQVALQLDGEPFAGTFRGRAGEDGFIDGATVALVAPRPDGLLTVLELMMPIELFEPGYHPLHSFESFGVIGLIEPFSGQFVTLGLLGDGGIQLDAASLEPGGTVSGRLTAKASYFVCASTVAALAPPAPPPAGEGGGGAADPAVDAAAEPVTPADAPVDENGAAGESGEVGSGEVGSGEVGSGEAESGEAADDGAATSPSP